MRALATNGGEAGLLLLRLKVLSGDSEVGVLAECFAGLLSAAPESSLPFVARYIDSPDEATAEAAMLALGESRSPAAYTRLKEKWERTIDRPARKVLLASMAASKLDEAISFLVSLIATENARTAADSLDALSIYRHNERITTGVLDAVTKRGDKTLLDHCRRDFENPA